MPCWINQRVGLVKPMTRSWANSAPNGPGRRFTCLALRDTPTACGMMGSMAEIPFSADRGKSTTSAAFSMPVSGYHIIIDGECTV